MLSIFRKQAEQREESSATTESQSEGSEKQSMVLEVVSPWRGKTKSKRKCKLTQSQISIGRKLNKLIVTLPSGKSSGDSSSPS